MGRGRGRGRGRGKRMVTSAEDLALRNEQQAAYQQKRAARRGEDGEDASESEDELPEFDAAAAEAMRNARDTSEKTTKKKSTTEGLIKTANPNAPTKSHMKMSDLGVPRCCGAFTPSMRLVSIRRGRGWFIFLF